MPSRRQILLGAGALGVSGLAIGAAVAVASRRRYEVSASALWRHSSAPGDDRQALVRTLVHYATLAPSSHNTQCWRFRAEPDGVRIEPDLTRRCPVVDPDDHHVFVSLGCAAENLALAARAHGFTAEGRFDAASLGSYAMSLSPAPAVRSQLFQAIPERQCTRTDYDGRPLSVSELRQLEQAGSGPGVSLLLMTERQAMETVLEYVVAGNTAQMNDAAFVSELVQWLRFSHDEAVRTGDGLFAAASGNPTLPRWIGRALMGSFVTAESENDKYARQVRSSSGIAVFVGEQANAANWVEIGRCYERFALEATTLGIRNAFVNQPVEVAAIRPQFATWLALSGRRPDLVVRFGRGPKMPVSLRRPVEHVLV